MQLPLSCCHRFSFVLLLSVLALCGFAGCHQVPPSARGVQTRLGQMSPEPLQPGVCLAVISNIEDVTLQQQTRELDAECFSSDLQQVSTKLKVLYRIPEASVIRITRDFHGDPFDSLILPRVQEAIKEVTATKTAAEIVKTREQIKAVALEHSREKVGSILFLEDLVVENVTLSRELEHAIEAKMVQEQEAEKAVYRVRQAETEAKIAVAKAKGEAESIRIQGEALEKAPKLIELKLVEKWNGVAPQVLGADVKTLLPINPKATP